MSRIFDGRLHVQYGQAYVSPRDLSGLELDDAFVSQQNGLCGAASPGVLFLITGLHTGWVGFTIDVLDGAPAVDDSWEEVVEVSFTPDSDALALLDWYGERVCDIPIARRSHRVRYSARGMEAGQTLDTCADDTSIVDFYQLAFWPAAVQADQILKQTSACAAYWHKHAKSL